jgi:hypothetical protein
MGTSGVLSQLFGGGSSSGGKGWQREDTHGSCSGEKGWYHDTTANNPDGSYTSPDGSIHYPSGVSVDGIGGFMRRKISSAKRLDWVGLVALSVTLVLATQPAVSCGTRSSGGAASQQQSSTKPVTLEDLMSAPVPGLCRHDAGDLVGGQLPLQDPHYGFVAVAHKSATDDRPQVAFGDLTGDGVDDGAMVTACTAGGVGWPATVQLYSAGPTRLGGIDLGDVTHGGRESVTDLSISNGVLHVSWITQGPGEPACCGTVKMAGDLRVNGPSVNIENVRKLN